LQYATNCGDAELAAKNNAKFTEAAGAHFNTIRDWEAPRDMTRERPVIKEGQNAGDN
jgi:hypothetical protein